MSSGGAVAWRAESGSARGALARLQPGHQIGHRMPEPVEPVEFLPDDSRKPLEDGIALSLSGGGYRAMLFHVGALWRLFQLGVLGAVQRISSVSGGSIVAAHLALRWTALGAASPSPRDEGFRAEIADPIRRLARVSLAGRNLAGTARVLKSIALPGSVSDHVAKAYSKHLFGKATLQDLPVTPRFVINAANLQSGALCRFSRPYVADWRVGKMVHTAKVPVARAVAASSAFPPFLAPVVFQFVPADYEPNSGGHGDDDLHREPYTTRLQLVDGGVYDNLGIETTYKRYRTLLVSNGGAPFDFPVRVPRNWVGLGARVISVIDSQVLSLRKRLLVGAFQRRERQGAFWDIDQNIAVHRCPDSLPCPIGKTRLLAAIATDLAAKDEATQMRLINWGYAVSDAALRAHVNTEWPRPAGFPYPDVGVG